MSQNNCRNQDTLSYAIIVKMEQIHKNRHVQRLLLINPPLYIIYYNVSPCAEKDFN